MPNRAARRRQAAVERRRHNRVYNDYIRHLPEVPLDVPLERGRVYHLVFSHDPHCKIYDQPTASLVNCTCLPVMSRHVEPRRT
jgi:hypothetical protein